MRAKISLLCLAATGCLLTSTVFAQQSIQWQPTLDVAKRIAGQTNRLVLIHFWSPSCEPCRMMERDVFPRPDVAAAVESSYVAVKLAADHFPATARQYGVSALPTDVVITPQGQVLNKNVGSADAQKYVAMLNHVAAGTRQNSSTDSAQALAAGRGPDTQAAPPQQYPLPNSYSNPPYAGFQGNPAATAGQPAPVAPSYAMQAATAAPPHWNQNAIAPPAAPSSQPNAGWIAQPSNAGQQPGMGQSGSGTVPSWAAGNSAMDNAGYPYRQSNSPVGPAPGQYPPPMQQNFTQQPFVAPGGFPTGPDRQEAAGSQPSNNPTTPPNSTVATGSQAEPPIAAGNPPLAMDGYCPVELSEKERWVKGNPRWGLIHEGRTYLFAGPEEQSRFYADPNRYAPAYCGSDVVLAVEQGQEVAGRREHGAWFDGRVYLFSSEASYARFSSDPYRYLQTMQQTAKSSNRNTGVTGNSGVRY